MLHYRLEPLPYEEDVILTELPEVTNAVLQTNHNNNDTNYEYQNETVEENRISPELSDTAAHNMKVLLENWGFSFLYETFLEERIDEIALKYMKIQHLLHLRLLHKIGLGFIIKFEQKLKSWQSTLNTTDHSNDTEGNEITQNSNTVILNESKEEGCELKLIDILNDNRTGRAILNHYADKGKLNNGCRTILIDEINSFLIQRKIKMSTNLAKLLSSQIIDNFPTEELGTYFVKQQGKRAISKIYSKYFNSQRTMKDCGLIEKRGHIYSSAHNKYLRSTSALGFEPEHGIEANLESISNDNCSFGELEHHWISTTKYRCKQLAEKMQHSQNCTSDVFEEWPHYKKALGFKLVAVEFEFIYGQTEFIQHFETSRTQLTNIMRTKIKDATNKQLLEILLSNNTLSQNATNCILLYLLHAVIPPVTREIIDSPSTSKQACAKFSIKDSQNSIFLIGDTVTQIEEKIQQKLKLKVPIQPFIIVQGSLINASNFVVFFDGCRYQFNCVLKALDTCFKLYMLFNLQYPQPSILVWNFIQLYYYNITTEFDKQHTSINLLIKNLKDA